MSEKFPKHIEEFRRRNHFRKGGKCCGTCRHEFCPGGCGHPDLEKGEGEDAKEDMMEVDETDVCDLWSD